ncbi:hypothetical protein FO519_007977 [Halicephalobus sp. NKZ332]|nr:hypothetical protein FO519_007977 [Halicephalobus sp. NKZ332]
MSFTISLLGYVAFAYIAYRVFKALYNAFYPFYVASPADLHRLAGAKWAIVTGSTDGIGKAYAFELAKKGFNLVLISRTLKKLEDTKEEIQKKYSNVDIKLIAFDFTSADLSEYEKTITAQIQKLEIGVLVNNVGYSYEYPDVLHKVEGGNQRLRDVLVCNTLPTTVLSSIVLPQMSDRHKGVIINISSSASYSAMQLWAVYSATKKYVTHLTDIIRQEYANKGITVQCVCPMMVATKMSKIRRGNFLAPNPDTYVKQALRSVGIVTETTGCFSHELQAWAFGLPEFIVNYFTSSHSYKTRALALKKRAKEQ